MAQFKDKRPVAGVACVANSLPVYAIAFCDVGGEETQRFAAVGANRVAVYSVGGDGDIGIARSYVDSDVNESFFACEWSTDEISRMPLLAVGGSRGIVKIINSATLNLHRALVGHGNSINDFAFHPVDTNLLLSASKDESLRLWNVRASACIAVFAGDEGHRDEVLSTSFHALGSCFVSSGMDNTIKIWSLDDGDVQLAARRTYLIEQACGGGVRGGSFKTCFVQFPVFSTSCVHPDYVDCVMWMGNLVLSKSTNNKIILWHPDPSRHKNDVVIVKEFLFADANIWFLRFCVDYSSQTMAVGSKCGTIYLWDVNEPADESGSVPLTRKLSSMSTSTIRQTAFSPDGRFLLCCCDDGTIWRWDRNVH